MQHAKLFTNGRSQAVRLPRECRFDGEEVLVKKIGNVVMLIPLDDPWSLMEQSLDAFSDDFLTYRSEQENQARESL